VCSSNASSPHRQLSRPDYAGGCLANRVWAHLGNNTSRRSDILDWIIREVTQARVGRRLTRSAKSAVPVGQWNKRCPKPDRAEGANDHNASESSSTFHRRSMRARHSKPAAEDSA
jgi:hypothetical protein